ncbi:MAG: hypothetical protein AMXMBFR57_20240 [Acidimicrobiia bacterium]
MLTVKESSDVLAPVMPGLEGGVLVSLSANAAVSHPIVTRVMNRMRNMSSRQPSYYNNGDPNAKASCSSSSGW